MKRVKKKISVFSLLSILFFGLPISAFSSPIAQSHYDIDLSSFEIKLKFSGEPTVYTNSDWIRSWLRSSAIGFGGEAEQLIGEGQIWASVPGAYAVANASYERLTGDATAFPLEYSSYAYAESYYDY